ncbi:MULTISPECIES: chorismate mutase [unclassified Saccharibacter]|uniref:chorismate mutase n=1 Tax=unclassified Saccharibacter TaxID=2648722 RepID=UPI001327F35F|nr:MULTISPECIES: chorismate mutase [unclassified Saccharibacter]MXV35345.1 chorismate mutase [Saccharibacter sp. EH611]MXV57807.1 chorismate mutase [Saccharibacter sp. EH70]MXV65279.1 chorismate mutase [Saccharibacter sp. EH60]
MTSETADLALQQLRNTIDNIDTALVCLLAERFKTTQTVGELKAQYQLPASDPEREAQQVARLRQLAENAQLDPDFAERFFSFVVSEVIAHHKRIASSLETD